MKNIILDKLSPAKKEGKVKMEQKPSNFTEKRRDPRIKTENTVEYLLLNEQREKIDNGEGRTRDLSKSGALLQTQKPLRGPYIILMTLDLEGRKVQVEGRVANTRHSQEEGSYLTGVEFTGSEDEQRNAIIAFVKAYYRYKHAGQNKTDPNQS